MTSASRRLLAPPMYFLQKQPLVPDQGSGFQVLSVRRMDLHLIDGANSDIFFF
jgi:hypothetical protein